MFVSVDAKGSMDKCCDGNMTEEDKDLMVLRLFSGREQRGHRLSNRAGTDRATRLRNVRLCVCSLSGFVCVHCPASVGHILFKLYCIINNYE